MPVCEEVRIEGHLFTCSHNMRSQINLKAGSASAYKISMLPGHDNGRKDSILVLPVALHSLYLNPS